METHAFKDHRRDISKVVAVVHGRDRRGDASVLDRVVGEAAGWLIVSSPAHGPQSTLLAARDLVDRGDPAGARLILRAVGFVAPDPALDEALAHLRPAVGVGRRVAVAACVTIVVALVASLAVPALVRGDLVAVALHLGSAVTPVLVVRGRWARHVRLPGLTQQESLLWRSFSLLVPGDVRTLSRLGDGHLRRATTELVDPGRWPDPSGAARRDVSGWVGAAGVVGAALGMAAGLAVPGLPPGAFFVPMLAGAVGAALLAWTALRPRTDRS